MPLKFIFQVGAQPAIWPWVGRVPWNDNIILSCLTKILVDPISLVTDPWNNDFNDSVLLSRSNPSFAYLLMSSVDLLEVNNVIDFIACTILYWGQWKYLVRVTTRLSYVWPKHCYDKISRSIVGSKVIAHVGPQWHSNESTFNHMGLQIKNERIPHGPPFMSFKVYCSKDYKNVNKKK